MANGFKINKQAMRKMSREIEREFAKNPVRVPLKADHRAASLPAATTVNNYNGPVVTVNGDHVQLAWDNQSVEQVQEHSEQAAPGYQQLAQLLTDILASLSTFQLDETDESELRENANLVLREVVKSEPDQGIVRRGVTLIKGLLAPISAGLGRAATEETADAARQVIDALGGIVAVLTVRMPGFCDCASGNGGHSPMQLSIDLSRLAACRLTKNMRGPG